MTSVHGRFVGWAHIGALRLQLLACQGGHIGRFFRDFVPDGVRYVVHREIQRPTG